MNQNIQTEVDACYLYQKLAENEPDTTVAPFMFTSGFTAIIISVACSAIGLFLIGSAITLFTGKSI
ncbi:hypothetical protein [Flavihumibacter profundi]|uniref:hypothetical protein n=1 Tax=Flavihumibacter profundi TaxID=2716883 RepID=UPI001CC5845C|nr:hypothetical protein [Flavihumibacter profundi]MBZ5856222.1 hypothetical protein [Flavihumibacter profundi]